MVKVLKLSAQGLPQSWISLEQAVTHYAADEVRWEVGAQVALFRGGHNAITGQQSQIAVNSIIGTKGVPTHQSLQRSAPASPTASSSRATATSAPIAAAISPTKT